MKSDSVSPATLALPDAPRSPRWLTTHETAKRLSVAVRTVQLWVEAGVLPAARTPGGHRRIPVEAVEALAASTGLDGERTAVRMDPKRASAGSTSPAPAEPGAPRDILVVEDDAELLKLWAMTLEIFAKAIRIRTASNGYQGLLAIGMHRPDVLVTDLMMPGLDGFQMVRALKATQSLADLEIIVVSAMSANEIERHGGLPDGVVVLAKPLSPASLVAKVDMALERVAAARSAP